jgi:NAD kinase
VLITRRTRLEELIARFHTIDQARFYVEHLGSDFSDYEREHGVYLVAKQTVVDALEVHGRYQVVERHYVPNYLFGPDDVVLVLGQDGLVANTMKYLKTQGVVGINPEPARYDGILLPFQSEDIKQLLPDLLADKRQTKSVTMAQATLPDGQYLLAVNDLFIGPKSHTSARYRIEWNGKREFQSSSGVIVSTGLGSTGWMTSVINGALRVQAAWNHYDIQGSYQTLAWDAPQLRFAVREPFPSKMSSIDIVYGEIDAKHPLLLTSTMPENGVIFSDGMESDFLEFNAGTTASIEPAKRYGRLIV